MEILENIKSRFHIYFWGVPTPRAQSIEISQSGSPGKTIEKKTTEI